MVPQTSSDHTAIAVAILSATTVLIAWIFRYKIAELARGKTKAPQEILFEGYERLLKSYQNGIRERDTKITELEDSFDKMQEDLNHARATINQMKVEDARKARVIGELELKLRELKTLHKPKGV